jgi:hypothetical protein
MPLLLIDHFEKLLVARRPINVAFSEAAGSDGEEAT